MKRRIAELPLHGGRAPAWLFKRMAKLAGAITMAIVDSHGASEMLRRLSDPWWFQAFGCVLGFDWHSSGLTTVTCGAMKEAQKIYGDEMGLLVAGGKGGTSRHAPQEIDAAADRHSISNGEQLIFASRMSAKVDSAAVQDGFQVYHHNFFFDQAGHWCVVQQGMNKASGWARRYHWLSDAVRQFDCEPHAAIHDGDDPGSAGSILLNMVAREADANRDASAAVVRLNPDRVAEEIVRLTEGPTLFAPQHHPVLPQDINVDHLNRVIRNAHEQNPQDFLTLLGGRGIGSAAVRSLSLLAELIYDAPRSYRDPAVPDDPSRCWADYSYAHGGKDGTPFPVDRQTYDQNINILIDAVRKARIGETEKADALRRFANKNHD